MIYGLQWGTAGAAIGALMLSCIPIVGTLVGGVIGGMVSYMAGSKFGEAVYTLSLIHIWHCQAEYEQVVALDVKCGNLLQELCRILRVERTLEDVKVDEVLRRQRLEREISQYTDDEEILSHLERVAVDQEQLDSLLKSGCPVIYLLGEHFQIPGSIAGTQLTGINVPVLSVDTQQVIDFEAANVVIHNCRLDEAYCCLLYTSRCV